jgi:hypothetical protein
MRKGGIVAVVNEARQVCVLYTEALGCVLPGRGRRESGRDFFRVAIRKPIGDVCFFGKGKWWVPR